MSSGNGRVGFSSIEISELFQVPSAGHVSGAVIVRTRAAGCCRFACVGLRGCCVFGGGTGGDFSVDVVPLISFFPGAELS